MAADNVHVASDRFLTSKRNVKGTIIAMADNNAALLESQKFEVVGMEMKGLLVRQRRMKPYETIYSMCKGTTSDGEVCMCVYVGNPRNKHTRVVRVVL